VLALLTILCAAAGLTSAQSAPADKHCYMWRTASKSATVYLLGSLHVGKPDLYPLDRAITRAFDESDALVLEVKLSPETEMQAALLGVQLGIYQDGRTLKDTLKPETLKMLKAYLKKRGMDLNQVAQLKPWFLGLTLAMQAYIAGGYLPQHGIDSHFSKLAARGGKEILQLETIEQQMKLLSGCKGEAEDLSLREGLKQLPEAGKLMARIVKAWRTGDADAVDEIMQENLLDDPRLDKYHAGLLDDRNVAMAEKVEGFLATDKTYFVVVGSAHLAGKKGIVQLLKNKKHKVEQVRQEGKPPQ